MQATDEAYRPVNEVLAAAVHICQGTEYPCTHIQTRYTGNQVPGTTVYISGILVFSYWCFIRTRIASWTRRLKSPSRMELEVASLILLIQQYYTTGTYNTYDTRISHHERYSQRSVIVLFVSYTYLRLSFS